MKPFHRTFIRRMIPSTGRRAFTLLEVMVAMSVLVLLVLLTAQLTNNATSVVTSSNRRMDADSESRRIFTRLAMDIDGMVRRADADCFLAKNNGNDAFYFYSQSVGYFPGGEGPRSPYAFVGYRIANRSSATAEAPNGVLERVGIGLGYDNTQPGKIMRYLSYPAATTAVPKPPPLKESTIAWTYGDNGSPAWGNKIGTPPAWDNPPYQAVNQAPLSSQVFRFEYCFLMKDGTYFTPPAPGMEPWNNTPYLDAVDRVKKEAVSLVITVAMLDDKSQLLMPKNALNSPDFTKAINSFADGDNADVAVAWKNALESALASPNTLSTTLGMPLQAAANIRIYQRSFRFNW